MFKVLFHPAVVVGQAVEQRHTVRVSQVRIPGKTWLFWKCYQSIHIEHPAIYKERVIKRYVLFLLLSCFISFKHGKPINCIVPMNTERIVKPQKSHDKVLFLHRKQ